jgi:hypothetical protein
MSSGETRLVDSYGEYEHAIDDVIAGVRHTLYVFDRRLSPEYNTRRRCGLLAALLQGRTGASIRITLRDTDNIGRDHPRLALLARQFSHRIEICRLLPHAMQAHDSFVIADQRSYVHRFHCDRPRARHAANDPGGAAPLIDRFHAIREASEPGFAATTLGLAP